MNRVAIPSVLLVASIVSLGTGCSGGSNAGSGWVGGSGNGNGGGSSGGTSSSGGSGSSSGATGGSSGGSSSGGGSSGGSSSGGSSSGGNSSGGGGTGWGDISRSKCTASPDAVGTTSRMATTHYVTYVPASYDKSTATPVVVALHGDGDTPENFLPWDWQANADTRGFIVVLPDSTTGDGQWDENGDRGVADGNAVIDDVVDAFQCYTVDLKKVIIAGFSMGGMMSYYLGLSQADKWRGIAIQESGYEAASMYLGTSPLIPSAWLIPVSHTAGLQDNPDQQQKGVQALAAAGHPTFWHTFDGGHTVRPQDALTEYDDLSSYTAP